MSFTILKVQFVCSGSIDMRKSREETAATRRKIVVTASKEFRKKGIAETGLKELMLASGQQTPGGFYKHFGSKEQLVTEAMNYGFERMLGQMEASIEGAHPKEAFETLICNYLSPKHRDRLGEACPLSALGSELRRLDDETGVVAADGMKKFIALLAEQMKGASSEQARKKATAVLSAMVGAVVLSRLAKSAAMSNSILKDTREFILQS
jgi:TetR/AcrR family transcriptional regulator, transcriptional repressor for nem operon